MSNVAFGSHRTSFLGHRSVQERLRAGPVGEEKRQASDRPQRGRGTPAGCRGAFEGGARGSLTSPSEAHRKSFLGQAAACRNGEAAAGLPAAEERLRAGPVGL